MGSQPYRAFGGAQSQNPIPPVHQLGFLCYPKTDYDFSGETPKMKMGATVTVTPGLVKRESKKKSTRTVDASESDMTEISMQESIAKLAYALWERNGCPEGTAERDWQEAERLCGSLQMVRRRALIF